ncbi:hypothetical protein niasHT_019375 [Heterodera trifolii]|uniref:Uncharacterized protein n=1 Tax=Heterodera trifolii TaxID=157864 RepID=A0ABD2L7U6_9BILA
MDQELNKIIEQKLGTHLLKMNEIAEKIENEQRPLDKEFIQQLIEEIRPLNVEAIRDHTNLLVKLNFLENDKGFKKEAKNMENLNALENQLIANKSCLINEDEIVQTYHKERAELERKLKRNEGNETIDEYDQKFIDTLQLNLEEGIDFGISLLSLADKMMDHLIVREEKKAKKNEQMSYYN